MNVTKNSNINYIYKRASAYFIKLLKRMNSTKSLILLALVGYTAVSGAVIKKNLAQADCPILSGQAVVGSSTLVSTSAAAEADTTTGSQVISDLSC